MPIDFSVRVENSSKDKMGKNKEVGGHNVIHIMSMQYTAILTTVKMAFFK